MNYIKLGQAISRAKVSRCGDNDYPVLSITMKDGIVMQSDKFKKRIASKDISEYKVIPAGMLVQGIHMDEGNFGIQDIVPYGIVSPAYTVWTVDESVVFPKYIEMVLRSPRCIDYYRSKLNGTVNRRGHMSEGDFLGMQIPCPSIEEQKHVVTTMNQVKQVMISLTEEMTALDQLIKARFVEMFGGCEELVPAGTIMSEMRNGISPSTSGKHHEKVLTLSAITQGRFDPTMWKDGAFDTEPPTEKRISAYDFYMCRGNGNKNLVGAGAYSAEDRRDLVFPDTVIAARVDTARVCLPYLFVAWMQPDVRDQIETGARTTNGTYKINQQVISRIKIPLPNIAQQKQFATFVSQVDKSKLSIQASLDQLETLKQSLMQKYFM